MWYDNLFIEIEKLKNETNAKKMSDYMLNKFIFLGIRKPELKAFYTPYFKESKKYPFSWDFIDICYSKDYREAQYMAIEYLNLNIKNLTDTDLEKLKKLITNKSWWETVDSLDNLVGSIILKNQSLESEMLKWSISDNIWLKRVSIDFQQRYKNNTNKELLEKIIKNNLGTKEFFINKAIGWSLREYSKTNKEWVSEFILKYENQLDKLSIKEAKKYF